MEENKACIIPKMRCKNARTSMDWLCNYPSSKKFGCSSGFLGLARELHDYKANALAIDRMVEGLKVFVFVQNKECRA